jgi:hypothetical protein
VTNGKIQEEITESTKNAEEFYQFVWGIFWKWEMLRAKKM